MAGANQILAPAILLEMFMGTVPPEFLPIYFMESRNSPIVVSFLVKWKCGKFVGKEKQEQTKVCSC
jgi:hypothetical protein